MRMYVFEGSPEEISQVVKTLQPITAVPVHLEAVSRSTSASVPRSEEGPDKFVSVDFARKVLKRRELSEPVRAMLKKLHEAGKEFVSSADLYAVTGYSVAQFSGLMGAFGRRMANTEGFDEEAHFFDFRWDKDAEAWNYRLPDTVREAIELDGLD